MSKIQKIEPIWKDRKHWAWFPWSFTKYSYYNDRLYTASGLLKTHYDELLLYRVTDLCLERSLGQKLCGTGTITLTTRGDSSPYVKLINIKHPEEVRQLLSGEIERVRKESHVVGSEMYGSVNPMAMGDRDMIHSHMDQNDANEEAPARHHGRFER